jgi:hypothetical protein
MLDQNLFTLHLTPSTSSPYVLDLTTPSGTVHYSRHRISGATYSIQLVDPLSQAIFAAATSPSPTSKSKTIELYNPPAVVELRYTGTISFKWGFKWEDHDFEWRREECFMIRKPDPPVLVAVTKEPPGKLKTALVQILDYNLNRFDIDDRKGLEIVILMGLLTFQDSNEAHHSPSSSQAPTPAIGIHPSSGGDIPPVPPPRPPGLTGIDRIAELQALRPESEYNQVVVEEEGTVEDYGKFIANELLADQALLFVVIKSASPEMVPKVLSVVEQTKRIRHKEGDDDIHQYVSYDQDGKKGPRVIKLDDDTEGSGRHRKEYQPPMSLSVHLSKIPMPELAPRPTVMPMTFPDQPVIPDELGILKADKKGKGKEKEKKFKDKDKKKARTPSPPRSKLQRPTAPHAPHSTGTLKHLPPHSYQTHPYQPSPTPSQLNNPYIYASPPPITYPRTQAREPSSPGERRPGIYGDVVQGLNGLMRGVTKKVS